MSQEDEKKGMTLEEASQTRDSLDTITMVLLVILCGSWGLQQVSIKVANQGVPPLIFACILYQTVWVAFITYLVWFWLIRHYPPSRVASFTFLTPLLGVLFGCLLLDEPVSAMLTLALILVGGGIFLVNR